MSSTSTYSRLNFSPVTPFRSRALRSGGGRRLMLGLTERHVRPPQSIAATSLAASTISGLPRTTTVLDRLNSPITRFHD